MPGASLTPKLPKRVVAAFRDREWVNLDQLAQAFEISERTMRRHVAAGTLPWHPWGAGNKHVHRAFTLEDAEAFWRRVGRPARKVSKS